MTALSSVGAVTVSDSLLALELAVAGNGVAFPQAG
jgi:hypothetical protein